MSENGAGMYSSVTSSDGQKVDNTYVPTFAVANKMESNILIYPNPFDNSLTVKMDLLTDSEIRISITDVQGKELNVLHTKESSGKFEKQLDLNYFDLSKGTYILKINLNGEVITRTLIKE